MRIFGSLEFNWIRPNSTSAWLLVHGWTDEVAEYITGMQLSLARIGLLGSPVLS